MSNFNASKKVKIFLAIVGAGIMTTYALFADADTKAVSDSELILSLERQWSAKFSEGDVDWMIALHAEDALQFPPAGEVIQGSENLRASWEAMTSTEGLKLEWEPSAVFISESGDMAWDYGFGTLTNPDSSTVSAKYLVVWKKIDGQWKVAADIFNMSGAPTKK